MTLNRYIVFSSLLSPKQRPYLGRSRKELRDSILARQAQIKKQEIPKNWSLEAADFVNRVIAFVFGYTQ